MRSPDLWLAVLACYLAGIATSALASRLRRRSWRHRRRPAWWCRRFHRRYHVAYSVCVPEARWCTRCGVTHAVSDLDWDAHLGGVRRRPDLPSVGDRSVMPDNWMRDMHG